MMLSCDYVLVKIRSKFNDELVINGKDGEKITLVINTDFRPTHNVRIDAEVIAAPMALTNAGRYYENYTGVPIPVVYRDADYVQTRMDRLPVKYRKLPDKQVKYVCGGWNPSYVTTSGIKPDVAVGDRVYFHYNCLLDDDNLLWREEDGGLVYQLKYTELFCRVRDSKITMLNGFVLISEVYDEGVVDIDVDGAKIKGKMSGDLVTEIGEKPKYLRGTLSHIGDGVGWNTRKVDPGEQIIYTPRSDFKNTIEGVEYYLMKQWDIVAVELRDHEAYNYNGGNVEFASVRPVGDYVMIIPERIPITKQVKAHLFNPNVPSQDFKPGEIFLLEKTMNEQRKDIHKNGIGYVTAQGEVCRHGWCGKQVHYAKGTYYLYVEEHSKVFVRESEILGSYE